MEKTESIPSAADAAHQKLFEEFPPVSREAWEEKIKKDLKGADYREKLSWKTPEGFEILPFYRREDIQYLKYLKTQPGHFPFIRGKNPNGNTWSITQQLFEHDPKSTNEEARQALGKGAGALLIKLDIKRPEGAIGGDLYGANIQTQEDFSQLLNGIDLENTTLHFQSGMATPSYFAMFVNEVSKRDVDLARVKATFRYDPWAFVLANGYLPKNKDQWVEDAAGMVQYCKEHAPNIRVLGIDAGLYHEAGTSTAQSLAYALAAGNEYLAHLTDRDLAVDDITSRIHFSIPIGTSYFMEIAKFRVLRLLWSRIIEQYKPDDPSAAAAYIHAETADWDKTIYDAHNNMLRATTQAMSAIIGGCDSVTVQPFDHIYNDPNDFSKRIARNVQIILKEESHLDKVADPAAGSYYIEELTDSLAAQTWEHFQEIEKQGGLFKAAQGGFVQAEIQKTRNYRDRQIAGGRHSFVGTNKYPNPEEQALGKIGSPHTSSALTTSDERPSIDNSHLLENLQDAFINGAHIGDCIHTLFNFSEEQIIPLETYRGAGAFEDLRLATERHAKESGETPTVLMIPMGDRRMRKARAAFSSNFFGCAGYKVKESLGYNSTEEAVAAVKQIKPDIAVLCSSDDQYKTLAPAFCKAVAELDKVPITVVAGYPKESLETLKNVGVDTFIHLKSNILEVLKDFHQQLEIEI